LEQPLLPFLACNLSAMNISKFVGGVDEFNWDGLFNISCSVMKYMDNLIDKMEFPDERFKKNVLKYRPVGIGIMGLADAMFALNYRYDKQEGRNFASKVMKTITLACIYQSTLLAEEKGPFFEYDDFKNDVENIVSKWIGYDDSDKESFVNTVMDRVRKYGLRNNTLTTVAPTGTTALSCDCSYGIEPSFGLTFTKNYIDGTKALIVNSIFEKRFKNEEWFNDALLEKISNNMGSLKGLHGIPKEVKEVFITAHEIKYRDRVEMQADIQKYCTSAISSTLNLPKETETEEVSNIYKYAYQKRLKGITIYRDGSKKNQPVTFTEDKKDGIIYGFERPSILSSKTYSVETGNGKMYVTVSDYKNKPLEVFIHLGKSGQVQNTFTEALGRIISIALQRGVPVEDITKTLIGINSDRMCWFRFEPTDKRPVQILSIPDAIAQLLNRYYIGTKFEGELSDEVCPKCGRKMLAIEGCFNCTCGYSKCS